MPNSSSERAHQGYRTQGRTPYQAFLDGVNQVPNLAAGRVAETDTQGY